MNLREIGREIGGKIDRDFLEIFAGIAVILTYLGTMGTALWLEIQGRAIVDNGIIMLLVGQMLTFMGAYIVGRGRKRRPRPAHGEES